MTLASAMLGSGRRDWAHAMEAEYAVALSEGEQLGFSLGCLLAAVKELPRHVDGRLALANQMLAISLLVPMAGLQFLCAIGLIAPFSPAGDLHWFPAPGSTQALYFLDACLAAEPVRLCLWTLLGVSHLRLAWLLVERDWDGVVRAAALAIAVTLASMTLDAVLMLVDGRTLLQAMVLLIELAAIGMLARSDQRLHAPELA